MMQAVMEMEVYQAGELTGIGFGGREILAPVNFAEWYDEVMDLIRDNNCQTFVVDLTGVRLIPSGLLGLLMSVYRLKVAVLLFNASKDIREVLEITKLDRLFSLHVVDV